MSVKPRRAPSVATCFSLRCSPKRQCIQSSLPSASVSGQQRSIHASPTHQMPTQLRKEMLEWFAGPGKMFRQPLPGSTNYLSAYNGQGELRRVKRATFDAQDDEQDIVKKEIARGVSQEERAETAAQRARHKQQQADARGSIPPEHRVDLVPFPLNPLFRSQPVLAEATREEIYEQVVVNKMDITSISAYYNIDIRRVAAIVRLKTIEKQWQQEGKKLARPYNDAVLAMLPQTPHRDHSGKIVPHESINDLPVHAATRNQLFWPTSESRVFTREDAATAFEPGLLPADKRIPHAELIELERWNIEGVSEMERKQRLVQRDTEQRQAKEKAEAKKQAWEARTQRIVPGRRWDFKFQDISVELAGSKGRGRNAVGLRYGYPHTDRKRGSVKIPTSVE